MHAEIASPSLARKDKSIVSFLYDDDLPSLLHEGPIRTRIVTDHYTFSRTNIGLWSEIAQRHQALNWVRVRFLSSTCFHRSLNRKLS